MSITIYHSCDLAKVSFISYVYMYMYSSCHLAEVPSILYTCMYSSCPLLHIPNWCLFVQVWLAPDWIICHNLHLRQSLCAWTLLFRGQPRQRKTVHCHEVVPLILIVLSTLSCRLRYLSPLTMAKVNTKWILSYMGWVTWHIICSSSSTCFASSLSHINTCTHTHTHTHTCILTHTHTCTRTRTHAHTHTHAYTHTHTHIHMHTHTHTNPGNWAREKFSGLARHKSRNQTKKSRPS